MSVIRIRNAKIKPRAAAEASGLEHLRAKHPEFSSASPEPAACAKLADAQLVVAREYGFTTWAKLKARVADVSAELEVLRIAAIEAVNPVGQVKVLALGCRKNIVLCPVGRVGW